MKIGIYCTVSSKEFHLALATLSFAELSEYISDIAILITDGTPQDPIKFSQKIAIYSENFGFGYSISIADGGYDQISARNFLIDKLAGTNADWLMMHDADDIYNHDYYKFISDECTTVDAITCSCFSLRPGPEICVPRQKIRYIQDKTLYDPHTRVWKKIHKLKYEKSKGIEKVFANHSRHCGVVFPEKMKILCSENLYHFHLHALLNKRHSNNIASYSQYSCTLPKSIESFLEINEGFFIDYRQPQYG